MLDWQLYRNLENSLQYFLETEVSNDGVADENGVNVPVVVGRRHDQSWTIPIIAVYIDGENSPERLEIGSNRRARTYLLIIDVFANNEGERLDIAAWITNKLKDGFRYYSYSPNLSNPESPTKTEGGLANIETFISNTRVDLGQDVNAFDAHRHRISFEVWISGC